MADTELTDSLGRRIVVHDRTWWGHILKGHPEMRKLRPEAEQAIREPLAIWTNRASPDCRLYFGKGPREGIMVVAVADVVLGRMKTAHLASKITGGREEWSLPTQ